MNYLKNRYKDFTTDMLQWGFCLIAMLVGIASFLIKDTSPYKWLDTSRFIFTCAFPFVIFLFGRNGLFYYFLVYGYVTVYFHDYTDYISFIIICMFSFIKPKFRYPAIVFYVLNIFAICYINDKDITHLVIHFGGCSAIYIVMYLFIDNKLNKKPLVLDEDQIIILTALVSGKQQKEIEGFSKNTVTKKIQDAMYANDCASKTELLSIFALQYKIKRHDMTS